MRTLSIPDQTGHVGQTLHTNGTNLYWAVAGGGGTGIVETVTGLDPIIIDATDPANLIASLAYDSTLFLNPSGELSVVGGVPALTSLVATTAVLPGSPVYSNGVAGVGATLTRTGNGAIGTIDGVTLVVGSRLLVKNQVSQIQNGIYEVTAVGSAGAPYVLTRTTDSDDALEFTDQVVVVSSGTTGKGLIFTQTTDMPVVGTDNIVYQNISTLYVTQQGSGTQAAGQIAFWTGTARQLSKGVTQLFWDNTNKRLGLGTSTPQEQLQLTGNIRIPLTTGSTVGNIKRDGNRILHFFSPVATSENNKNLWIGYLAGNYTMTGTSAANIGIGSNVGAALTTGVFNTMIGVNAGQFLTTGTDNNFFGLQAGRNVTTGTKNVYIGESSGYGGSGVGTNTGSHNIGIGETTLYEITSGSRNFAGGISALQNTSTGVDNVAIGHQAGDNNQTGQRLLLLGSQADVATGALSDSIALGYGATITASNQMVIGSDSTNINDFWLGRGTVSSTPNDIIVHATDATGADVIGGGFTIMTGMGTGNAAPALFLVQTAVPGASGVTPQTATTGLRVSALGFSALGDVDGAGNFCYIGVQDSTQTATMTVNTVAFALAGTTSLASMGGGATGDATIGDGIIVNASSHSTGISVAGTQKALFQTTALSYKPHGTSAGNTYEVRYLELAANGTNYMGFKGADSRTTSLMAVLPSGDPTVGQSMVAAAPAGGVVALSWQSTPVISSGAVAPSSTPTKVGDIYVDTVAKKMYIATGTASSADWTITN